MNKGFTLIEVLAYIAIATIIFGGIITFSEISRRIGVRQEIISIVDGDGAIAMDTITQTLRDATIIAAPRASTTANELVLGSRDPSIGPFIYVAGTDVANELQVINVASSSSPYRVGAFDMNSGSDGPDALSIALNESLLYIGRTASAGAPEFYIFNISTSSAPSLISSLEVGSDIVSMSISTSSEQVMTAIGDTVADFQIVNVANSLAPSVFSITDVANLPQDVIFSSEANRTFIASSDDAAELQVMNGGVLEASFDLTVGNSGNDTANGTSIALKYPYIFLARANSAGREFFAFDISVPSAPSLLGQLDLSCDPNDIAIIDGYAFIASTDDASELQIVNISTPSSPVLASVFNLTVANSGNDTANAISIAHSGGNFIYLGRANSTGAELSVLDVSNPLLPSLSGSTELLGDPNDLVFGGGIRFDIRNGLIRMRENNLSNNLTSFRAMASNLFFANLSASGTAGSSRFQFNLNYNNPYNNPDYIYQNLFIGSGTLRAK